MPPRNPELPEGTDHIINGAMETGAGTAASTGSSGGAPGGDGGAPIGGGGGFVAGAGTGGSGDDTGGTAMTGGGDTGVSGGGDAGGGGGDIKQQVKDNVQSLIGQATERVRTVADDGKNRATSALDDLSRMMNDAGSQIDERLGGGYGDYARRAAEAVTGLADTIRDKEVEDLWEDARGVLRKSPGVALGIAAVVGFTVARMVKAGAEGGSSSGSGGGEVEFRPEGGRNIDFQPDAGGGSAGTGA